MTQTQEAKTMIDYDLLLNNLDYWTTKKYKFLNTAVHHQGALAIYPVSSSKTSGLVGRHAKQGVPLTWAKYPSFRWLS